MIKTKMAEYSQVVWYAKHRFEWRNMTKDLKILTAHHLGMMPGHVNRLDILYVLLELAKPALEKGSGRDSEGFKFIHDLIVVSQKPDLGERYETGFTTLLSLVATLPVDKDMQEPNYDLLPKAKVE